MNATPDPLAPWRTFVCEEDLSPETTEIAMAIADQAIGKRASMDLVDGTIGYDWPTFVGSLEILANARLVHYDATKDRAALSILFAEERTPPEVVGDRLFDAADYQERHGNWEATPPSIRRRTETLLYHYYDAKDVLLYIGITNSLPRRQASHESRSTWMDFAVRSTMKRFPTRASAEVVEAVSIRHKRPLFNVEHNDHPDREARLVDYLIARDRRDLLVPLISRG